MPTKNALHHGKKVHIKCRRCGRRAYHLRKKKCAACGYGSTSKLRRHGWDRKTRNRKRRLH